MRSPSTSAGTAAPAGPRGADGGDPICRTARPRRPGGARRFSPARSDSSGVAIGIAGASIGANVARAAAADDPAIRSLALLSPGLDYRSLRTEAAMQKYGARPALLRGRQQRSLRAAIGARTRDARRRSARGADARARRPRHDDAQPRSRSRARRWWTGFNARCYDQLSSQHQISGWSRFATARRAP